MNCRKIIALTLIVLTFILTISGCGGVPQNTTATSGEEDVLVVSPDTYGFEEVFSTRDGDVAYIYYRCRTTNAMYVWRQHEERLTGGYTYGGFTAMLDPATNGPLTYENWLAYLEAKNEAPAALLCTNCDNELATGTNFCPNCGTKIN